MCLCARSHTSYVRRKKKNSKKTVLNSILADPQNQWGVRGGGRGLGGVRTPKSDQTDIQVSQNQKYLLGNLRQDLRLRTSKINVSNKARRRRENFEDLGLKFSDFTKEIDQIRPPNPKIFKKTHFADKKTQFGRTPKINGGLGGLGGFDPRFWRNRFFSSDYFFAGRMGGRSPESVRSRFAK